jgi:penicillin-binding protein 1B
MAKRSRLKDFLWRHSAGLAFLVMVAFVAFLGFVGYTYVVITKKFDSATRWDLPSRVYSDGTPIVPGTSYARALLEPKLNHVGYREVKKRVENPGEYRYVGDDLEIFLNNFEYPDMEFHATPVLVEMDGSAVRSVKRVTDGITLRGVRIEPELITSIYDNEMEDRMPVSLDAVPKHLVDAIIATEDKRFYSHEGISFIGIGSAIVKDIRSKAFVAGGSTLTQQLVKNLYLTADRTITRKAQEALMALLLEMRYSKEQILEAYCNEIYLGNNGSVQIAGVEQASRGCFGK